jgi:hypothetical protein
MRPAILAATQVVELVQQWAIELNDPVSVEKVAHKHGVDIYTDPAGAIDTAFADRLIPQMSQIDDGQEAAFRTILETKSLNLSAEALRHLLDPHSV